MTLTARVKALPPDMMGKRYIEITIPEIGYVHKCVISREMWDKVSTENLKVPKKWLEPRCER